MMKKINVRFFLTMVLAAGLVFAQQANAQEKKKKTETVEIQSSVVCGMCKERVTKEMTFEKGVKAIDVNLKTKVITLSYNPKKTDEETLKIAITKIGYDADDLLAEEKAYEKLPACCKKGVDPH